MKTNKLLKKFIILVAFFAIAGNALGQIKIEAPNMVSVGEVFNFNYVITGQGKLSGQPSFPSEIQNLAYGSTFMQTSINGKATSQTIHQFTLRANKEGKYTFGAMQATDASGNSHSCNDVTIEVIAGQNNSQNSGANTQQGQNAAPSNNKSNNAGGEDVFMRMVPSRTTLYRGDNLTLSLKLYRNPQVGISGTSASKFPSFDGFWTKDIDIGNNQQWHRENINGKIYEAILIKQWTLSPQKSGNLRIEPIEITWGIQKRTANRNMFFPDIEEYDKPLRTPTITIVVKDMPSGAPQSYTGAVGKYTMNATISRNQVTANDAVTLNVKISGSGNMSLISAPKIEFPSDFDSYDPKKTESGGSINFEYNFVPRSAGTFIIEPVKFSYFNPTDGKYTTLSSNPMTIEVAKDPNATTAQSTYSIPANQRDVKILGKDIRFIKPAPEAWKNKDSRIFGVKCYYPFYLILIAIFAALYFYLRKKNKNSHNIVLMRNRKAKSIAKKRLKVAEKLMKLNSANAFYEELSKAVYGYLGDKYSLPLAELSRDNVSEMLASKNVEKENIDKLIGIIDECEYARYAPGDSNAQMHTLYNNTIEVISTLEQKTK